MRKLRGTAAGAVVATLGLSGCWLQPGFDAGRSNHNSDEDTLTTETVSDLSELWATSAGSGLLYEPVVNGGNVYVTGENHAASLSLSTGDVRWLHEDLFEEILTPPQVREPAYHDGHLVAPYTSVSPGSGPGEGGVVHLDPDTGEIAETTSGDPGSELAVADGALAVRSSNGSFYAGLQWRSISWPGLPRSPVHTWGATDSHRTGPFAIVGERILWSYDNQAEGYSEDCPQAEADGAEQHCTADWSTDLGAEPGRPVAIGTDQVAYSAGDTTYVLDTATGTILWTADVSGRLAAEDDTLFVSDTDNDRLVALPADGCGATTCSSGWEADVADLGARPTIGGDVVYVPTDPGGIQAYAADGCGAATCSPLTTVTTAHDLSSDLVVARGHALATTSDGKVVAFGLED